MRADLVDVLGGTILVNAKSMRRLQWVLFPSFDSSESSYATL